MIKESFLSKIYQRNGDSLYFGAYPQTEVSDSGLISALNNSVDALPTLKKAGEWTSYGYYVSGMAKDCMWYVDKEYEGKRYRGVYFTSYRPDDTTSASCVDNSRQYDNGYALSKVYWFKFEPIKWEIIGENEGIALVLAEKILDSGEFYSFENGTTQPINNWEYSSIREWLNTTFYNTAFNDWEKAIISRTALDNKTTAKTNEDGRNRYATNQNDTIDNLFLLSYKEVKSLDNARQKEATHYAKAQGVGVNNLGKGWWWLRSPFYLDNKYVAFVSSDGNAEFNRVVTSTAEGVVPALAIKL